MGGGQKSYGLFLPDHTVFGGERNCTILDESHKIEASHFRSWFRAVIIYCTLCRFDEFSRLQDRHFTDKGDHVEIVFERRKNDQFGDNSKAVIAARPEAAVCPVALIRLYFRTFQLQFQGSGKSVNFRIQKQAGSHRPLWNTSLAQSNATKLTRQLCTDQTRLRGRQIHGEKP